MKWLYSILIFLAFFPACKVDNTLKLFDSIELNSENHSFAFMLASNHNFISTLAQENHFNAVFSGNVPGIPTSKLDGFIVFPDGDAGLGNSAATAFKSLYDANGNNTFSFYPEVYENMTRYDVQYTNWKNAIKNTIAAQSPCAIGTKIDVFGKNINIYVKTKMNTTIDSAVNVAVYVVNETVVASQDTNITDSDPNYVHYNVLTSSITASDFGDPVTSHSVGVSNNNSFTYSSEGVNTNNVKFVVVVFEMHSGLPKRVLNCRTLKL